LLERVDPPLFGPSAAPPEVEALPELPCGVNVVTPPALDTPPLDELLEPVEGWGV
jgi:hypothetical protein